MANPFTGSYSKFWVALTAAVASLVTAYITGGGVSEQELRLLALAFLSSLGVIAIPAPGYVAPSDTTPYEG